MDLDDRFIVDGRVDTVGMERIGLNWIEFGEGIVAEVNLVECSLSRRVW